MYFTPSNTHSYRLLHCELAKLEPNYLLLNHLPPNCSLNLENHCLAQIKMKLYAKLCNILCKYSNPKVHALLWIFLGMKCTTKEKSVSDLHPLPPISDDLHLHILRCLYTQLLVLYTDALSSKRNSSPTNYGYEIKNGSLPPTYNQNNVSERHAVLKGA